MSTTLGARIRQLDPQVINKIAAGEVIERPASVVKELLENSIDALATRIDVDLVEGGTELIRIADDGEGIHPDDLLLAVSSHATSKIVSDADLFSVKTMGFRGEALASIASVSRFRIRSRQPGADTASEIIVDCGRVEEIHPSSGPAGTLIEVRQLFANTPVRRKFLKTKGTEFGHVTEQFTRIALANPNLHLTLRHNGKSVYELPAAHDLRERLRTFFGDELAGQLIPVDGRIEDLRLWGFVAHPGQSRPNRKGQHLFLNGRWIQDRTMQAALGEAYRGLMMVGRYPLAFLFLEMPTDEVDVNVHPCKWEVRFRDTQQIFRLVLSTIRNRFLEMNLTPEFLTGGPAASKESPLSHPEERQRRFELAEWARQELDQAVRTIGHAPQMVPPAELPPPASQRAPDAPARESLSSPAAWSSQDVLIASPGAIAESAFAAAPVREYLGGSVRAMQILDCYLVVDDGHGLTIIDQHALHERIMYEYLRRRVLSGSVESQKLLLPLSIELSPAETAMLLEQRELLGQFGYGLEEFGKNTVLVTRYPVMMSKADHPRVLRDLVQDLDAPGRKLSRRDLLDAMLHMMSCKAAVKAGQRLSPEEIESLLSQRHLIDDAHHCPHGRPTALVLTREQLDRQFGRLGA